MKIYILFFSIILFHSTAWSQEYEREVKSVNFTRGNHKYTGYATSFEYQEDDVQKSLFRFLKNRGKTETQANFFRTWELSVTFQTKGVDLYARTISKFDSPEKLVTEVSMGIDTAGMNLSDFAKWKNFMQKTMREFQKTIYLEDLKRQINEGERITTTYRRELQRLMNEGTALTRKLDINASEKTKLEKELEVNIKEREALLQRIELNKKVQELANYDIDVSQERLLELQSMLEKVQ